jgi:hypothetical protein
MKEDIGPVSRAYRVQICVHFNCTITNLSLTMVTYAGRVLVT